MHTDMTAVTIQSNKSVSNEVKDNQALLELSYGKKQMNFLANPMHSGELAPLLALMREQLTSGFYEWQWQDQIIDNEQIWLDSEVCEEGTRRDSENQLPDAFQSRNGMKMVVMEITAHKDILIGKITRIWWWSIGCKWQGVGNWRFHEWHQVSCGSNRVKNNCWHSLTFSICLVLFSTLYL